MASAAGRFAANLRRVRDAAGLSQEAVAFGAGLHRTQISLLERGDRLPRIETLVKLAGATGTTPDDLLAGITWEPITVVEGGLLVAGSEDGEDAAAET